jgi:hypothetical protein
LKVDGGAPRAMAKPARGSAKLRRWAYGADNPMARGATPSTDAPELGMPILHCRIASAKRQVVPTRHAPPIRGKK